MAELDLEKVRSAWRDASPGDVVRALRMIEDYPPSVAAIIRQEAERRGLDAESEDAMAVAPYEPVRRLAGRSWVGLTPLRHWIDRHPRASGLVWGILAAGAPMVLVPIIRGTSPALYLGTLVAIALAGLVLAALSLRSYGRAFELAFSAWFGLVLANYGVGVAVAGRQVLGAFAVPGHVLNLLVSLCVTVGVLAAVLCTSVYVRNRYWPAREPGHCRVCEYNLRGLTEARCPECGTPFDPAEVGAGAG
jgi:hypothetical protein